MIIVKVVQSMMSVFDELEVTVDKWEIGMEWVVFFIIRRYYEYETSEFSNNKDSDLHGLGLSTLQFRKIFNLVLFLGYQILFQFKERQLRLL